MRIGTVTLLMTVVCGFILPASAGTQIPASARNAEQQARTSAPRSKTTKQLQVAEPVDRPPRPQSQAPTPVGKATQQPSQIRALADTKVGLHNGALTSSIPIQVPAFHGITPQLALAYNSSGGNGFVGVGWDLQGFSVIERASPSHGSPRYSQSYWTNDRYYLDGEELVSSYALGGTYATRRQSFLQITGSGPGSNWTVIRPDGTVMTFTPVFINGSTTFRWGLSSVRDTHGNVVNYNWWCDQSVTTFKSLECYPASVSYATTMITLNRESRPDPETFATGFGLGQRNYRLNSIAINASNTPLRSYRLTYATTSTRTSRSLLTNVQQFGKDNYTALPATSMTWSDTLTGFDIAATISGSYGLSLQVWQSSEVYTDDFNGDGRADFLLVYTPGYCSDTRVYLLLANTAGGFANASDITYQTGLTPTQWCFARSSIATGDFNGDGKADLLVRYNSLAGTTPYNDGVAKLLLANSYGGFGTAVDITNTYGMDGYKWHSFGGPLPQNIGDFNGDGYIDVLVLGTSSDLNFHAFLLSGSSSGQFNVSDITTQYGMTAPSYRLT